jgi:ribulose-5-phosphate 4-epimerase/fuculose-1-phosphate aldolase
MQTEERLIAEAAQANRALGAAGQSDMVWGHASVRDHEGRGVWMKAAGWSFEELTGDRVMLVSPAGEVLVGTERRHIEYPIHTEVMRARPDVNSVVHTHAPAAVAFAALDEPLLAISHDGVEFAEPQIARFTRTGSLISSAELGRALATTIGDGVGCLIPQHGLVTVGPDAATAVMRALLLARACDVQLRAMAAGQIRLWSGPAEIARKKAEVWPESQISAGYAYLCRRSG